MPVDQKAIEGIATAAPWNPQMIEAIIKSYQKWLNILMDAGVDKGSDNCALCLEYHGDKTGLMCRCCPIYLATGRPGCKDTPYDAWVGHHNSEHHTEQKCPQVRKVHRNCSTCYRLAADELRFVRSLLPPQYNSLHTMWLHYRRYVISMEELTYSVQEALSKHERDLRAWRELK